MTAVGLRLRLRLQYGADLVYSEEIVDFKAPLMTRVVNGVYPYSLAPDCARLDGSWDMYAPLD